MRYIPYGYQIVGGKAVIVEKQADQVRLLFENYISGMSLQASAENAGLHITHSSSGRILRNKNYLGNEYYPAIIDEELFDKAEEKRMERVRYLNRCKELKPKDKPSIPCNFKMAKPMEKRCDPYKQAEYLHSLLESEV